MRDRTHQTETRKTEGKREDAPAILLPDPRKSLPEQEPAVLLAMVVFGETRGQSKPAQRAVAQVALNRAKHPHPVFGSRAGAPLEENLRRVLLRPGQFSSLNRNDPNYPKLLSPLDFEPRAVWKQCLRCAQEALAGAEQEDPLTSNSDHYFDDSIQLPSWADPAKRTVKLDRLNFYRLYLPPPRRPRGTPDAPFSERSGALSPERGPAQESPANQTVETGRPSPAAHSLPGPATRRHRRESGVRRGSRPPLGLPSPLPPCTRAFGITENGWVLGGRGLSSLGPSGAKRHQYVVSSQKLEVRRFFSWLLTSSTPVCCLLVLLSVLLTACSDLERTAYRTFAVTRAEYEMIQQQVAEEAVHGLITEEQWNRFRVQGHRFIAAYNTAVDAFVLWSQAKTQQNTARLESVLESLPRLLGDLQTLVQSFQKEPEPEERLAPSPVPSEAEGDAAGSQKSGARRRTAQPPTQLLLTSNFYLLTSYEAPWR